MKSKNKIKNDKNSKNDKLKLDKIKLNNMPIKKISFHRKISKR